MCFTSVNCRQLFSDLYNIQIYNIVASDSVLMYSYSSSLSMLLAEPLNRHLLLCRVTRPLTSHRAAAVATGWMICRRRRTWSLAPSSKCCYSWLLCWYVVAVIAVIAAAVVVVVVFKSPWACTQRVCQRELRACTAAAVPVGVRGYCFRNLSRTCRRVSFWNHGPVSMKQANPLCRPVTGASSGPFSPNANSSSWRGLLAPSYAINPSSLKACRTTSVLYFLPPRLLVRRYFEIVPLFSYVDSYFNIHMYVVQDLLSRRGS